VPDFVRPDRAIGVYETLLVLDDSPIELEAHLQRLSASVRELFAAELPAHARELVIERAAALPVGRLRLTVTPGTGGVVAVDVVAAPVDPENVFPSWQRAIALRPFVVEGGLGGHKWADRDGLAWTEATEPDGALPLVLDVGEEVLEASRANVFAVEGDSLVTPPTDGRILPGVARAAVIASARSLGIEVREESLGADRLLAAPEAFLTGSVRGIEPVRSVSGTSFQPPGETLGAITAEMRRKWVAGRHSLASVQTG
jgi:para-aminobenzoate synthetase / 4-amino-4-deoxychorismate lyase